ncbi:hypothetical protein LCGC14_3042620 [marine sediment metagenome]|uniref:Uncharacterized protein n=1 Tax=marine sediment metagenome TaxID=412755 RepID=A0A0F8YX25_9ZZZZ
MSKGSRNRTANFRGFVNNWPWKGEEMDFRPLKPANLTPKQLKQARELGVSLQQDAEKRTAQQTEIIALREEVNRLKFRLEDLETTVKELQKAIKRRLGYTI